MSASAEVRPLAELPASFWSGPVTVGALAVVGTAVLAVVDPSARNVPLCPLKAITGLDCPFCGSLRAVHALTQLDVTTALDHNAVFTLSVPLLVAGWVIWFVTSRGVTAPGWWRSTPALRIGLGAFMLTFAVVRNLPAFSWLASTA
jgi:hypothetical protein